MRVIGTAGHVDHGKSTLIAALTGIHPDRLKEEKEREMTIDLGFGWMILPDQEMIGIVDVPGHRDFIENMLAGIGGIDLALFVVAADEGVMPQTREHLAILDLLKIHAGIIVITKTDLVADEEWLDLVELDVLTAVKNTVLENAPIIRVSSKTGMGLESLKLTLMEVLKQCPERMDYKRPRLPVDRVFSISGFGTVVTGTLIDGTFNQGDEVEVLPSGLHGRIRGLQTHNKKVQSAKPGSRTAINISGIEVDQIKRGEVVVLPGNYQTTKRMDVFFQMLNDASASMKHNAMVKLFIGAAEVVARVRVLGVEEIAPGQTGWLQLELEDPVVAIRGDRMILRRPSPGETLGGGQIVDPHPARRHKRFSAQVLHSLNTLQQGIPEEILLQTSIQLGLTTLKEIAAHSKLSEENIKEAVVTLLAERALILLDLSDEPNSKDGYMVDQQTWSKISLSVIREIDLYHTHFPLRRGIPREELKSKLKMEQRPFLSVMRYLITENRIVEIENYFALPTFEVRFSESQKKAVETLQKKFVSAPFSPPSIKECQTEVGDELYAAMVTQKILFPVSREVVFLTTDYEKLVRDLEKHFQGAETLTVAEFRDRYQTSRKYALAFLEFMDSIGMTIREGDLRKLRKNPLNR